MFTPSASARAMRNFSLTYKCNWHTPGEVSVKKRGQGVAALIGTEWVPANAANMNAMNYGATFYRGRGYVRLASARS